MTAVRRFSGRASVKHVDVEQTAIGQSRLELVGLAAAGIAHDLNNQFTLILNHLAVDNMESARDSVGKCIALTAGLLTFCRGENVPLEPTSLLSAVQNFVNRLRLPAGVTVALNVSPDAATIRGDEPAIERVLDNLVRNAASAMNGSGCIRISVHDSTIEVEDSGPGIPRQHLRRIFEPFFTTGGTGMGLAIVRDIMRRHGGSVHAVSEPGKGAKFILRFRTSTNLL